MMKPVSLLAISLVGSMAQAEADDAVHAFIRKNLTVSVYKTAAADLDGDGRREVFVYVTEPGHCGSGGCDLFILTPSGSTYRVVMHASVTRAPIRLLPTSTNGWRDVGVQVAGGGIIIGYTARLRFDGRRYPSNPTVPPAVRLDRPTGRVLIAE